MKTYGVRQHGKETMSRRQCDSDNQCEFGGEMGIHYSDLKGLAENKREQCRLEFQFQRVSKAD